MNAPACFLVQLGLALVLAPLLPGVINRVKAKVAGRRGKPLLQTYYDIAKLLRKGEVISRTTTWTFAAGPGVSLAAALCALALLPMGGVASPLAFGGDFLLAAYLLGMGRFATMLAALDTGSSFEGMGASREAAFSALGEPALFLAFLTLTSLSLDLGRGAAGLSVVDARAAFSLSALFNGDMAAFWQSGRPELLLAPAVVFALLLAADCRNPEADPPPPRAQTNKHQVMVVDNYGT
ncbi:MAG: NADH-quinone oxidoreductase subunit H, partial [Desulfovibrio sp.]|nr:NADH-quinone oxidoreductase subunit H [Desulfovibrio sp.]